MKRSENVSTIDKKSLYTVWKGIHIHKGDYDLSRIYKGKCKISMTAVLHMLIETADKCLEEKYGQKIDHLEKQLGHLAGVVLAYRDKYGKIELDRNPSAAIERKNTAER